jgi:hypothetical protein
MCIGPETPRHSLQQMKPPDDGQFRQELRSCFVGFVLLLFADLPPTELWNDRYHVLDELYFSFVYRNSSAELHGISSMTGGKVL